MVTLVRPEFTVNQYQAQWQEHPDVARLSDGNFVVVWDSFFADYDRDIDSYYIAARVYSPTGVPLTDELVVSGPVQYSRYARVDALVGGGFAIAWEGNDEQFLLQDDIYVAAYNNNGTVADPLRRVTPVADEYYYGAEVVGRYDGGYTVLWSANEPRTATGGFAGDGVFAQSFGPNGAPLGGIQHVNVSATADQSNARAVRLTNGNLLIAYDSEFSTINAVGNPVDDLRARILSPTGVPIGQEFLLTTENDGVNGGFNLTTTKMSVSALSGGRFVATWNQTILDATPQGDTGYGFFGRIFGPTGAPQGNTFLVGLYDSVPDHSSVTRLDGGGFVVVFDVPTGTDAPYEDIYGQLFSEWGVRIGGNFRVNQRTDDTQEWPSVAPVPGGGFVVTFQSDAADFDHEGIAARVFGGLTPAQAKLGAPPVATAGPDNYNGTAIGNAFNGLGGNDVLRGNGGNDVLGGGNGNDAILGGDGSDRLDGQAGNDAVRGEAGNDLVAGGVGNDRLFGDEGNDRVDGGTGNDVLTGGGGADVLDGGAGNDVVAGGPQNDRFLFARLGGRDVVADFQDNVDTLVLDDTLWGPNLSAAGVINRFARDLGTSVVLEFAGGESVTLRGVLSPNALVDDLIFV